MSCFSFFSQESHLTYMDYHNRFGLSPVNPDKVDLQRYPLFAHMKRGKVAHLHAGDALLIPDGWWHQVRTWPGRNIAVTWEFEPYEGVEQLWPNDDFQEYLNMEGTLMWSRQVRMKYLNKALVTRRHGKISCNSTVSEQTTAESFKCSENHHSAEGCNFQCIPQTCITQQLMERQIGFFYSG